MFATSYFDDAAAWVGIPVLALVTCLGIGLLAERLARVRLPTVLLVPTGFAVSVVALMPGYELGADARLAAPLLALSTVAGFVVSRRDLRRRLRPGPTALAALAVLALYLAPTVLNGSWTWGGYNFLNDTSVQMILADQLAHEGAEPVQGAPSTRSVSIKSYLGSAYPLGAHAHLATLATLDGTGVDVAYQGYLAFLALVAMLALTGLARRVGLGAWAAPLAAAVAVGANLFYQYALQGSVKEVAAGAALLCAAALGRELLTAERPVGMVVLVAIAFAAMFSALSSAAGPYLVLLAVALLAGAFIVPDAAPLRRRLAPIAAVGAAAAVVASLPTLVSAVSFLRVATAVLTPTSSGGASTLGQLAGPLEPIQMAGIWLSGSYSAPVADPVREAITLGLSYLAVALAIAGLVVQLRRREPAVAILLFSVVGAWAVVAPRATDYADAKLLAVATPAVLFAALCGGLGAPGRARVAGLVAAAAVTAGVVWSDAYAYHSVRLAPVDRLEAFEEAADRTRGRQPTLHNELEEFGKYYGRHSVINNGFEALTVEFARPQGGGYHVDLDSMEPGFVQRYRTVILRRGADVSRPPANFTKIFENAYYQVWERRDGVRVGKRRVALQGPNAGAGVPTCASVRELAREARGGAWLVAAPGPDTLVLDVAGAKDRPVGWGIPAAPPGVVQPATPGVVKGRDRAAGGLYDAWVRGSSGRDLIARVDGREVGRVKGMNPDGQWMHAGTVRLSPGRHRLELERTGGGLAPGDGAIGQIGPLELVRRESGALTWLRPDRAGKLCGKRWDWIEVADR